MLYMCRLYFKYIPANIRLDEDVLKTYQEQNICLTHTSSEDAFKTSSTCLDEDQIIVLAIRLQDVFKTSCQDIFKTYSRCFEAVFKTSSRLLTKIS